MARQRKYGARTKTQELKRIKARIRRHPGSAKLMREYLRVKRG